MSKQTTEQTTSAALQRIADVSASVQVLKDRLKEIREQREAIARKAAAIVNRPLSRADVKAFALDWIDECAQQYKERANMALMVDRFLSPVSQSGPTGPITLAKLDQLAGHGYEALASISGGPHEFMNPPHSTFAAHSFARMYFFFGDIIKAKVSEAFDERFAQLDPESPSHAEPLQARREAIAALKEQDSALSLESSQITGTLRSMGYTMTYSAADVRTTADGFVSLEGR